LEGVFDARRKSIKIPLTNGKRCYSLRVSMDEVGPAFEEEKQMGRMATLFSMT